MAAEQNPIENEHPLAAAKGLFIGAIISAILWFIWIMVWIYLIPEDWA